MSQGVPAGHPEGYHALSSPLSTWGTPEEDTVVMTLSLTRAAVQRRQFSRNPSHTSPGGKQPMELFGSLYEDIHRGITAKPGVL